MRSGPAKRTILGSSHAALEKITISPGLAFDALVSGEPRAAGAAAARLCGIHDAGARK
jgi:hypothetical protein